MTMKQPARFWFGRLAALAAFLAAFLVPAGSALAQAATMTLMTVNGAVYVPGMNVSSTAPLICGTYSDPGAVRAGWLMVLNADGSTRRYQSIPAPNGNQFCANVVLDDGSNLVAGAFTLAANGQTLNSSNQLQLNNRLGGTGSGALRVQLTWDKANDMDLHLYSPTAAGGTASNVTYGSHIYYGNPNANWGSLDIDSGVDNAGYGPENITITSWPTSGRYLVEAINYSDNGLSPINCTLTYFTASGQTLLTQRFQLSASQRSFTGASIVVASNGSVSLDTGSSSTVVPVTSNTTQPVVGNPNQPLVPPQTEQVAYTLRSGQLPADAVSVAATGTLGNATINVTLDLARVLANGFAGGYNVYLGALVPGRQAGTVTPVWFLKGGTGGWAPISSPLATFMENVALASVDERRVINVIANTDITRLIGTEIYIGYGLSDSEMLASNRYRGIYRISE